MIILVTLLSLFVNFGSASAGLPPTSTKGSGASAYSTTFKFDFPFIPITQSGITASFGQIPAATGISGILPYSVGGTNAAVSWTQNSILFANASQFSQDNTNFIWNDSTDQLFAKNIRANLTKGSMLFAGHSGEISQDNSAIFWDIENDRLGIGTASPAVQFHTTGASRFAGLSTGVGHFDSSGNLTSSTIVSADISSGAVANIHMQNMAQNTIKGNNASAGPPLDLTATQATAILNNVVGATALANGTKGLAPAPTSADYTAGKFLSADGTYANVSGVSSALVYSGTVVSSSGCGWDRTGTTYDDPVADADCDLTQLINSGAGTVVSYTSAGNELPGVVITLNTAKYVILAWFGSNTSNGDLCQYEFYDGTTEFGGMSTSTSAGGLMFTLAGMYSATAGSKTIRIRMKVAANTCSIRSGGGVNNFTLYWMIYQI